eukprot:506325-Pyramimonas_sp.AAC.1
MSPVRAPSPTPPIPPHNISQHSLGGTTQIQESDTARIPQMPRMTHASGRPAKARTLHCVAEQPGTTFVDSPDSGDSRTSIVSLPLDYRLFSALSSAA